MRCAIIQWPGSRIPECYSGAQESPDTFAEADNQIKLSVKLVFCRRVGVRPLDLCL